MKNIEEIIRKTPLKLPAPKEIEDRYISLFESYGFDMYGYPK